MHLLMETQIKIGIEKLQFSISKYGNLWCDKQSPVYDKEAKGPVMNFFVCDFILFVCLFLLYFCIESHYSANLLVKVDHTSLESHYLNKYNSFQNA